MSFTVDVTYMTVKLYMLAISQKHAAPLFQKAAYLALTAAQKGARNRHRFFYIGKLNPFSADY
jgi:hypothetical protein